MVVVCTATIKTSVRSKQRTDKRFSGVDATLRARRVPDTHVPMLAIHMRRLKRRVALFSISVILSCALAVDVVGQRAAVQSAPLPAVARIGAVRQYIKRTWTVLTRSTRDLPRAAPDPKIRRAPDEPSPVYVAADEDRGAIERSLRALLPDADLRRIDLRVLSSPAARIVEPGLLFLPHPYVVPGGRFNEMYGWDSYFIQRGLLRDGELELARDMADNFLYEIAHYGMILNANRTYFLTRSQPPFLTEMILGVFERTGDRAWLRSTVAAIDRYYAFWTTPPHLIESIGLSRYYDLGDGP